MKLIYFISRVFGQTHKYSPVAVEAGVVVVEPKLRDGWTTAVGAVLFPNAPPAALGAVLPKPKFVPVFPAAAGAAPKLKDGALGWEVWDPKLKFILKIVFLKHFFFLVWFTGFAVS